MTTRVETYYRDHWLDVEPERQEAYERMFQWRPELAPLLEPAEIEEGQAVADYGCGPGHLAAELARRVGPTGRVHALDINRAFLERTAIRAREQGLEGQIHTHLVEAGRVPLADETLDRVVCKNVLEYVDDPAATLAEFHRVLRPGGVAHVTDSDWGLFVVEPLGERTERLMEAASVAFRTPLIGRSLYGLFRRAGFQEIRVRISTGADTEGGMRPVLANMAAYARASGRLDASDIDAWLRDIDKVIADGTYLGILPQFLVTGRA